MSIEEFFKWQLVISFISGLFSLLALGIWWGFGEVATLRLFTGLYSGFFLIFFVMFVVGETNN